MPHAGLLHPEPLPLRRATADPDLHRRHSDTLCLSLCGVSGCWCAQGLFEPSGNFWQVWDLILTATLTLLPSCWGFFFVSAGYLLTVTRVPRCHRSSTYHVRNLHISFT